MCAWVGGNLIGFAFCLSCCFCSMVSPLLGFLWGVGVEGGGWKCFVRFECLIECAKGDVLGEGSVSYSLFDEMVCVEVFFFIVFSYFVVR